MGCHLNDYSYQLDYLTTYDQVYYFYTEDADASARNGKNPEQVSWNDQTSQMRMQNEIMNLYKKNNVSMFGSLWTFLTLPIMFAMYGAVQRIQILYTSQAFGMNLGLTPLSQITSGKFIYIAVILVMALSQFFAIEINNLMLKRNKKYKPSAQQNQMKTMNIVMTLMIIYFGLIMPTAMSFYWITTNLITVVRTVFIQIQYIEKQENQKDTHVIR